MNLLLCNICDMLDWSPIRGTSDSPKMTIFKTSLSKKFFSIPKILLFSDSMQGLSLLNRYWLQRNPTSKLLKYANETREDGDSAYVRDFTRGPFFLMGWVLK